MQDSKEIVAGVLEKAIGLKEFGKKEILAMLETPPQPELGDIAFPVYRLAGAFKKDPKEIALDIAGKIEFVKQVKQVRTEGAYLNFYLNKETIAKKLLPQILGQKDRFSKNSSIAAKKILIEYSQPNTNKPLHIGHLRNNAVAMSVSLLLEKSSAKVKRVDLFNDRGIHICQSMLAYKKWGEKKTPQSEKMKSDHFVGKFYVLYHEKEKELPDLKKELSELLLKWEKGDKEVLALWKKMNKWATDGFKQTYTVFGSKFDKRFEESVIFKKAKPVIELGLKKGVFERDETGAVIANLEKFGLGKKTVIRADGTSIYLTQDLALANEKYKYFKFDKSVYVVASEQRTYFLQLFKILELLGYPWAFKLFHLSYGLVNLPEGKLKSREGKIVDADTLIEDLSVLAEKEITKRYKNLSAKETNKRSREIALGAIKFYMLKTDCLKNILFDPSKAISFEGDSGPYVMYSFARAKSILRKEKEPKKFDAALLEDETEKQVITLLNNYKEVVEQSARDFAPHRLCGFLLELSGAFNSFYHKVPVLKAEKEQKKARLVLVKAVSMVLEDGLKLLNIVALEKM